MEGPPGASRAGRKRLGDRGESLAAEHLARAGWRVVARNFRTGRKEIDLVARRGEVVAFVEVKTRTSSAYGHPLESITRRKQREIQQVAEGWVQRFGAPGDTYRFDAIAICYRAGRPPLLEHVEDAWRA